MNLLSCGGLDLAIHGNLAVLLLFCVLTPQAISFSGTMSKMMQA